MSHLLPESKDPNNKEVVTTRHLDGRPKSVTGTAAVPRYFAYKVDSSGRLVVRVQQDSGDDPDANYGVGWSKTISDWIGRTVLALGPTTDSGWHTGTKFGWNATANAATGHLEWSKPIKQTSAGASQSQVGGYSRYEYDAMGALKRTGLDVDSTSDTETLVTNSGDRIVDITYGFEQRSSYWWFARRSYTYPYNNATSLLVDESFARVHFPAQSGDTTIAESEAKDRFGNLTNSKTIVNRTSKWLKTITNTPDSTSDITTEYRAGVPVKQVSAQNVTTLIAYDAYGRLLQQRQATAWPNPNSPGAAPDWTQPNLLTHYGYYDGTDLVKETGNWADPAFKTNRFTYDNFNRVVAHTRDNDSGAVTTYSKYDDRGFLTHQWGTASHPVRYDYDTYGRRNKLHTYRASGSWTGSTFPTTDFANAGEETTWNFDGPTGLLTSKTDAKGKTINFTYNTDRNQLLTRQWARLVGGTGPNASQRVTATYGYNNTGSNRTGELASITYNDDGGTTNLAYTYHRDGQLNTVADATGTRTFEYGSTKRELIGEILPSSFFGSRKIARFYHDGSGGSLGGALLATAFGPASNPWAGPGNGNITQTNYGYDWTKGRLADINRLYDSSNDITQRFEYAYETNGNRISSITSKTGASFATTSHKLEYFHQSWRHVVDDVKTYGKNGGGLQLKGNYHNDFDWMGRRTKETTYNTPGLLGITTPATQEWSYNTRSEVESETVKHNGTTQTAKGRSYTWDNGWNRATSVTGGSTTTYAISAGNEIDSTSGHEGANYTYDDDGNLIGDGTWTYKYDAENRLKTATAGITSITYTYDYQGRRVCKAKWVGSTPSATYFIFDGWNLIAELDANKNPTRTYTWGPDATGAIGGGGTGGLLMISQGTGGTTRWFPVYDSRHNITGLLDANGTAVAEYTYDSFGRETASAGSQAANNPFRFATQYTETDIGLVYFGHRFYSSKLGRFINRDPIGEAGGLNLYAYAGNDGVNHFDVLGLSKEWVPSIFDTGIFAEPWPMKSTFFGESHIDSWSYYGGDYWSRVWDQHFARREIEDANKSRRAETAAATKQHFSDGQAADQLLRYQSPDDVRKAAASATGSFTLSPAMAPAGGINHNLTFSKQNIVDSKGKIIKTTYDAVDKPGVAPKDSKQLSSAQRKKLYKAAMSLLKQHDRALYDNIVRLSRKAKVELFDLVTIATIDPVTGNSIGSLRHVAGLTRPVGDVAKGQIHVAFVANGNISAEFLEATIVHEFVHVAQMLNGVARSEYEAYKAQYEFESAHHVRVSPELMTYVNPTSGAFIDEAGFNAIYEAAKGSGSATGLTVSRKTTEVAYWE